MRSRLYEGRSLKPSARTLWEIQALAMRPPVEVSGNLYAYAKERAYACIKEAEANRANITDMDRLRARQAAVREAFWHSIGSLPNNAPVINAAVTSRMECAGHSIENIILETRPDSYATCSVYTPRQAEKPCPAVLLLIGHTDAGKADMEYQYAAQLFCRAGFVVLALDPYGEGERFEHYDPNLDLQPIQGCSGEHDLMDWKFKLMGVSLARYFVSDALAALQYLKSRSDVDGTRVALTGHSGGGTQVSMLMLAAADEFACAAPCAYITDMRAMIDEGVDPDNEMIWPGSLLSGIDYADILLSMAPKPLAVLANTHDFFPVEGTNRTYSQVRSLWKRLQLPNPPELVFAESEHAYGQTLAWAALSLFSRSLLGRDICPELKEKFCFVPLDPEQLHAAGGSILKSKPDMVTLQQEADRLLKQLQQRPPVCSEELRSRIERLIQTEKMLPCKPRIYREGICAPYAYHCLIWRSEPGIWLNAVLLRSMVSEDRPLSMTVMLWPGGTSRIAEHSHLLSRTIAGGRQALILDLPGEGALLPAKLGDTDLYIGWSTMYKLNAYLIQLGDSLAALRTRAVIASCRMLEASGSVSGGLNLYAEADMDRYAMYAGIVCGVSVQVSGACESYEEKVTNRFHDQTHTHAWALPGVLEAFRSADVINELKKNSRLHTTACNEEDTL